TIGTGLLRRRQGGDPRGGRWPTNQTSNGIQRTTTTQPPLQGETEKHRQVAAAHVGRPRNGLLLRIILDESTGTAAHRGIFAGGSAVRLRSGHRRAPRTRSRAKAVLGRGVSECTPRAAGSVARLSRAPRHSLRSSAPSRYEWTSAR